MSHYTTGMSSSPPSDTLPVGLCGHPPTKPGSCGCPAPGSAWPFVGRWHPRPRRPSGPPSSPSSSPVPWLSVHRHERTGPDAHRGAGAKRTDRPRSPSGTPARRPARTRGRCWVRHCVLGGATRGIAAPARAAGVADEHGPRRPRTPDLAPRGARLPCAGLAGGIRGRCRRGRRRAVADPHRRRCS